jgi:hypothetical protein
MTILTRLNYDCATGETTEIPLTAEEIAIHEAQLADLLAQSKTQEAEAARIAALKESAKSKLVAGQPLTEEEASVLVM